MSMTENKIDGLQQAIDALKGLDTKDRLRIIAEIALNDPELAAQIKGSMIDFEDIAKLSVADFSKLKQKVDAKIFHIALRKTTDGFKQKIKLLMSERAYSNLLDDVDAVGAQKLSYVEECQKEVILVVRALVDKGEIALAVSSAEEEYVA